MILQNNTIVITGGSSGLGLQMAKFFLQEGNKVIICSRSTGKLQEAQKQLPGVVAFQCDLSLESERVRLSRWLADNHPKLNILINNAAIVHRTDFSDDPESYPKALAEIATNLVAPIHLSRLLLPVISQNDHAAVVNITTGLVYAPRSTYPFYNATKSALHAFTQVLREQLKDRKVRITEVMFPVVDTPWHAEKPPKIAISPATAVDEMMKGLKKDKKEIRVGAVKKLYYLTRIAPGFAFKKINALP